MRYCASTSNGLKRSAAIIEVLIAGKVSVANAEPLPCKPEAPTRRDDYRASVPETETDADGRPASESPWNCKLRGLSNVGATPQDTVLTCPVLGSKLETGLHWPYYFKQDVNPGQMCYASLSLDPAALSDDFEAFTP